MGKFILRSNLAKQMEMVTSRRRSSKGRVWQHRSLNGLAADLKADRRFLSKRFHRLGTMLLWLAVCFLFLISAWALKFGLLL